MVVYVWLVSISVSRMIIICFISLFFGCIDFIVVGVFCVIFVCLGCWCVVSG